MQRNKYIPLAAAIAALSVSPFTFASEPGNDHGGGVDKDSEVNVDVDSYADYKNDIKVSMEKSVHIGIKGKLHIPKKAKAPSAAVVDSKQYSMGNHTGNMKTENEARIDDNAGKNSQGNIGANVASGTNNAQANDAAIAKSDAKFVFADAEVFSSQDSQQNKVTNVKTDNDARLQGNAFQGANGNIGVNVASGDNNNQQNGMALSQNEKGIGSVATTGGIQTADKNETHNKGHKWYHGAKDGDLRTASSGKPCGGDCGGNWGTPQNTAQLEGNALKGAQGNVGVNVASGSNNLQRNSLAVSNSQGGGISGASH